jgi:hypothetical protein
MAAHRRVAGFGRATRAIRASTLLRKVAAGGVTATVTVEATDSSATEGGGTGQFTFTRAGTTAGALTVNFTVTGTATSGTDYTSIGTSVEIADGQATATVTVTALGDAVWDESETVIVTLAAGSYDIGSPSDATVTITGATTPSTIFASGKLWWAEIRDDVAWITYSDVSGTNRISAILNQFSPGTDYGLAQADANNRPALNLTGLLSQPSASFDRTRDTNEGDHLTFNASLAPGGSYTLWMVLAVTAHTSVQRVLRSNPATHQIAWNASEAPGFDSSSGGDVFHTTTAVTSPVLARFTFTVTTGAVAVALGDDAQVTGTIGTTTNPTFVTLGGVTTNPVTMQWSAGLLVTGVYGDAAAETLAVQSYFLSRYPGLYT